MPLPPYSIMVVTAGIGYESKLHLHCIYIKTHLKPLDLWNEPVAVAELLQQWRDALAAAGGSLGTSI